MLSFSKFRHTLYERFLTGFQAKYGYCEVFQNPTAQEMAGFGQRHASPIYNPRATYGDPPQIFPSRCRYFGGILTPTNLFIFDRESGEHFAVAREVKAGDDWLPLYLYYYPDSAPSWPSIVIDFSDYSMSRAFTKVSTSTLERRCSKHPALKKFHLYDMHGEPFTGQPKPTRKK